MPCQSTGVVGEPRLPKGSKVESMWDSSLINASVAVAATMTALTVSDVHAIGIAAFTSVARLARICGDVPDVPSRVDYSP